MAANNSNKRGGLSRARQISNQTQTPIQQAAATVGKTVSTSTPAPQQASGYPKMELGVLVSSPSNTGLAGQINSATRGANEGKEPAVIYVNRLTDDGDNMNDFPVARPNPLYEVPDPPPRPNPESPKTESIIASVVDQLIEDSKEVVVEIEVKKDPARPPVEIKQDIVRPPAVITPTELVLQAQASCEKDIQSPSINIVNEINLSPIIDLSSSATSSIAPIITISAGARGCTDPDAINYDPLARIDDESCKYEPIDSGEPVTPKDPIPAPINMPEVVVFVDSHGAPLFEVLKSEVTKTEQTESPGYSILPDGTKLVADLQLVDDVTRPALEDSDIILSLEDSDLADRKNIRTELGELASDNKLQSEQDIIILGDRERLKKDIIRNDSGIIFFFFF